MCFTHPQYFIVWINNKDNKKISSMVDYLLLSDLYTKRGKKKRRKKEKKERKCHHLGWNNILFSLIFFSNAVPTFEHFPTSKGQSVYFVLTFTILKKKKKDNIPSLHFYIFWRKDNQFISSLQFTNKIRMGRILWIVFPFQNR